MCIRGKMMSSRLIKGKYFTLDFPLINSNIDFILHIYFLKQLNKQLVLMDTYYHYEVELPSDLFSNHQSFVLYGIFNYI